jgi:hypothetical protein
MNEIGTRQNSEGMLRLMRARSRLYLVAERLQWLQLMLTVIVPVGSAVLGLIRPQARPYVAILAFSITMLDVSWIDRSQRTRLKTAAKISEQFDCAVLDIEWNKFLVGKRLDAELIAGLTRRWRRGDESCATGIRYPPSTFRS